MAAEEKAALVALNDCNCPLSPVTHRYGKGCVTACTICGAMNRCEHDDEPAKASKGS